MASKAIYSEIVELVLSLDKYEAKIAEATSELSALRNQVAAPLQLGLNVKLDEYKFSVGIKEYNRELQRFKANLDSINRTTIKASLGQRLPYQGVDSSGKRTGETYMYSDAKMEEVRKRAIESAVLENRLLRQNIDLQREAAMAEAKRIEMRERALKTTMGYKVGSFASGARVGAGLDMAAGAAFAMGSTNLGGALYMMERLSYATGVGQKNLGEFAQKLGLVKLQGDGAADSIAKFGNSIMLMSGALVSGIAAIGMGFSGAKLDKALADMSTLLADASVKGKDFQRLLDSTTQSAARLSSAFGVDIVEIVNGFKTALSTGIDAGQLEEFGAAALRVSKGLNTTFDDAVNILTTLKDAYKGGLSDMAGYSDALFNAINVGKFQVDDLRANLGRVAVAAGEAGVSMQDTMTYLALFTRAGLSTSQSITSLNRMIVDIVNPTDKAKKLFNELGIAYGSAALRGRSLADVMEEIKEKTGGSIDIIGELFPQEQGRRGAAIATSLTQLARELGVAVGETGTAAIAANRAMDTFGQNVTKIWLELSNTFKIAGVQLLDILNGIFDSAGSVNTIINALKGTILLFGTAVNTVALGVVAVVNVVKMATSAVTGLVGATVSVIQGDFQGAWNRLIEGSNGIESAFARLGETTVNFVRNTSDAFDAIGRPINDVSEVQLPEAENAFIQFYDAINKETVSTGETVTKVFDSIIKKTELLTEKLVAAQQQALAAAASAKFKADNPISMYQKAVIAPSDEEISLQNQVDAEDAKEAAYKASLVQGGMSPADAANIALNPEFIKYRNDLIQRLARVRAARIKAQNEQTIFDYKKDEEDFLKASGVTTKDQIGPSTTDVTTKLEMEQGFAAFTSTAASVERAAKLVGKDAAGKNFSAYYDELKKQEKEYLEFLEVNRDRISDEDYDRRVQELEGISALVDEIKAKRDNEHSQERQRAEERFKDTVDKARKAAEEDAKLKREQAAKDFDNAYKLYQLKMRNYANERKAALDILGLVNVSLNQSDKRIEDWRMQGRGPEYTRRQQKELIEADLERMRNTKFASEKELADAIRNLRDRIDSMVAAGDQSDSGRRARTDAEEFENMLRSILAKIGGTTQGQLESIAVAENTAKSAFNQAISGNAVAEAIVAAGVETAREVAKEAAKAGLTVSGDLLSNIAVDIRSNIDLKGFESKIRRIAEETIIEKFSDKPKGKPGPDNNFAPTGTTESGTSIFTDGNITNFAP